MGLENKFKINSEFKGLHLKHVTFMFLKVKHMFEI
jgi:hypothetical protein